ncbi:HsdM family class I SAM-dependent methyltransferase [Arcobacter sp.]|uniref:HsdM family class I SAM-dependent methyltransferase n=1 Tax=Arcobacter sp. TaxID=1872629 RepID=UPI003D0DD4EA
MGIKLELSSALQNGLSKLQMLSNNTPKMGLKFVSNINSELNNYIKLHLLDAKKYGAQAVYFRFFENRPPIPQIYIYEENIDINVLHKKLWSSCKIPIFFVFTNNEIKIFNSMSKNDVSEQNIKPIEVINLASKTQSKLNKFSAKMFDTGEFWNEEYNKSFSHKNSAYNSLLDKLEIERKRLIEKSKLSPELTNSLLIKSILLKYLEEKEVFELNYWNKFLKGAKSFIDICKSNEALVDLFDALSNHFNGGIFKLSDENKKEIINTDLAEFQYFLQPNIDNNKQLYFWDLYSFKDLPIELISNIYELFLIENEKEGVVYTPSVLVDFMIDEMIPLDDTRVDFKVIDPACGSGIFLVGTFKRLVQRWMIQNNFRQPSVKNLKSLITNNIFGVDEKKEAVEVAKFSLSLAICEILAPEIIWNELHFDDLSQNGNLIANDFFDVIDNKESYPKMEDFDLVIGNPPFISKLTTKSSRLTENKSLNANKNRPKLPDNQLAYLFLEQSFKLLKENAFIALVQPSGFLYNNNVEQFRKYLFKEFNLRQVIDFTGLNKLYDGSKKDKNGIKVPISVPSLVVCFENNNPNLEESEILHLTIRQTFESKEKLYFNLSYYDFHWLNYSSAIENKYIWKCNLLGGSRTIDVVNRLDTYRKLGQYLEEKIHESGWIYLEGFMDENSNTTKPKKCDYITGHPFLPAKAFLEKGIDNTNIYNKENKVFHRIKPKELFSPPHLLIKKQLGKTKIISEFRNDYLTFKNDTIGIHAPKNDESNLYTLSSILSRFSKEYLFYLASTSAKAGIDKATVLYKNDIDNLPYPENIENIRLSQIEEYFAEDTINYMLDWINGKQNLPIFKNVSKKQLLEYQKIYCDLLNTIYDKFKALEVLQTEQLVIMSFYYNEVPESYLFNNDLTDYDIETLINYKICNNINIVRIFKYYDNNLIYIIKPKQYRYWLKSIAVRDADDTFADLVNMRY